MYNPIQDFTGAVIKYQVATGGAFQYKEKNFTSSYDEMLLKLKEPDVRGIKILKIKTPKGS